MAGRITVSAKEKRTYLDRVYDSKAECEYAMTLDLDPDVVWWIRQPGFDLGVDFRYHADFLVAYADGNINVVDVKGMKTDRWPTIVRLWKKYGPLPLRVVTKGRTAEIVTPNVPEGVDSLQNGSRTS